MKTVQVQTKHQGNNQLMFIQRDGKQALHAESFCHKGVDYHLLGGVYYDLNKDIINKIFGE